MMQQKIRLKGRLTFNEKRTVFAKSFVQQAVMIANGFEDGDQEKLSHAPKMPCLPRTPIRRMQNVSSCTNFRISWRNCNKKAPRLR